MRTTIRLFALIVLFLFAREAVSQTVHHVRADASGANDGTSWTNALTSLQDALAAAGAGDQIWVAAGTYRPDQGDGLTAGDRSLSFDLKSGVRVHGGFAGTETTVASRDLSANRTILSGDLLGDDDGFALHDDNSYHVVRAMNADENTLLDAFVIVGGNANGADADSLGGGILIAGGAPWITNTRVNSNMAGCGGGVTTSDGAAPTFVNAVVNGNRATTGGGFCNLDSDPAIANVTVSGNTARRAPGVYNNASSPSITNSVVAGNLTWEFADLCELQQFRCSLADVSPEARAASDLVLEGAASALESAGSLQDAVDYLESHPDVVEVYPGIFSVGFRVPGGALSLVVDGSSFPANVPNLGKARSSTGSSIIAENANVTALGMSNPGNGRSIIGEDWNNDGVYDNRDGKRALILSPLGFNDAEYARDALLKTPGYWGANTVFRSWLDLLQDTELEWWTIFDRFDFVYLSTILDYVCAGNDRCVPFMLAAPGTVPEFPAPGVGQGSVLLEGGGSQPYQFLHFHFFDFFYAGQLTNSFIHCAHCRFEESILILALAFGANGPVNNTLIGGFVIEPDSFSVDSLNVQTLTDLNKDLIDLWTVGISTDSVLQVTRSGINYEFVTFWNGPPYERPRIMELPVLLYAPNDNSFAEASPLVDMTDISNMVHGVLDDNEVDGLDFLQLVYGVDPDKWDEFDFAFFFDDQAVTNYSTFDFAPTGSPHVFGYVGRLNLETPLESGIHVLESVVTLPDRTESRYRSIVTLGSFSCRSSNVFTGFRGGAFTGAANWSGVSNGAPESDATLTIESASSVLGFGPEPDLVFGPSSYNIQFLLADAVEHREGPTTAPDSVTYTVQLATLGSRNSGDVWFFSYLPDDSQCPDCMASVRVDSVGVDRFGNNTVYGIYDFIGKDVSGTRSEPRMSRAGGSFAGVPGSTRDVSTPYFGCLDEYWTTYEEAIAN